MQVGVIGINYKVAELSWRENLARACDWRFSADCLSQESLSEEGHHFILLSTCNRTEIYFYSEDLTKTHSYLLNSLRTSLSPEYDQRFYSFFGYDCFLHLCRVTAGLDSAVLAETEIQGQVKTAYEKGKAQCTLPYDLHYLFQKSLKVGKEVRSAFTFKKPMPGIEDVVFQTGLAFFNSCRDIKILCIGASSINLKILSFLKAKEYPSLAICNRTTTIADQIAEKQGIKALHWEKSLEWQSFDWLIFGTKASHYLLKQEQLANNRQTKLIIDLGVPRNVDPLVGKTLHLMNIDQLNQTFGQRSSSLDEMISQAEFLVQQATAHLLQLFSSRSLFSLKLVS